MKAVGLLGCGAVVHANYAKTLIGRNAYSVQYVCDTNEEQAASAAALFDADVVDLDELASKAEIIVISTPPSTHAPLVRACLGAGRTILCEKPFMTDADDALQIVKEAEATQARLYVGHFRRTFPNLELAERLVSLGTIGDVTAFSASEGGRFTWKAVSDYPVRDPNGGVLWDTGSHTIDMALFASGLDRSAELTPTGIEVVKDKDEPSHDLRADFAVRADHGTVSAHLHVSRKHVLPNLIRIKGTRGEVAFVADLDDRVRLTTEAGTTVLSADRSYENLLECFDLQLRRIFLNERASVFEARRFVGQIKLLESLAHA